MAVWRDSDALPAAQDVRDGSPDFPVERVVRYAVSPHGPGDRAFRRGCRDPGGQVFPDGRHALDDRAFPDGWHGQAVRAAVWPRCCVRELLAWSEVLASP